MSEHEPTRSSIGELSSGTTCPTRSRLPATRRSITHKFSVSGHEGYIIVGFYDDGRPGEVFLKMAKKGSTIRGLTDTIGVLTSMALQHGVPIETLAEKFEGVRFEPQGWTKNPSIGPATSLVDYVFRWLRQEMLTRNSYPCEDMVGTRSNPLNREDGVIDAGD